MSTPITLDTLPAVTDKLLDNVEDALARYVVFPTIEHRLATAVWVLHTHVSDAFDSTPRLAALSPEKGSGKTRLLEILNHLCHRPIHAANSSVAAMFRIIAKTANEGGLPPTMLLDEADTIFGPKAPVQNEELRGLVNAGHRRGVGTIRCVGLGADLRVEKFEAFAPVAIAGIGALPDTITQRAVVIPMRRRAPGETVKPFRLRNARDELEPIREALATWGRVALEVLDLAEPQLPHGVEDRPADVWEPLLAIGELAGEPWTTRVRGACKVIVTADQRRDAEDSSLGLRLLDDLRHLWPADAEVMFTEDILAGLHAMDEAPWPDLWGKPIDARKLARYLKPYEVRSQTVRQGDATAKGYRLEDLADPWSRYLPSISQGPSPASPGSQVPLNGQASDGRDAGDAPQREQAVQALLALGAREVPL